MQIKNYKNHLLIAMPSQQSDFFVRSVVFIYEYSEKMGAIGFAINKPLSATLGNVLEHLKIPLQGTAVEEDPVFSGGPVGPDQGFVIHDRMSLAENDDDHEITISTTREILQDIAAGKGPDNFIVTLGYAGWEPGQLEQEVQNNLWLLAPLQKSLVFTVPIAQRWTAAAKFVGVDFKNLSSHVGHA